MSSVTLTPVAQDLPTGRKSIVVKTPLPLSGSRERYDHPPDPVSGPWSVLTSPTTQPMHHESDMSQLHLGARPRSTRPLTVFRLRNSALKKFLFSFKIFFKNSILFFSFSTGKTGRSAKDHRRVPDGSLGAVSWGRWSFRFRSSCLRWLVASVAADGSSSPGCRYLSVRKTYKGLHG